MASMGTEHSRQSSAHAEPRAQTFLNTQPLLSERCDMCVEQMGLFGLWQGHKFNDNESMLALHSALGWSMLQTPTAKWEGFGEEIQ